MTDKHRNSCRLRHDAHGAFDFFYCVTSVELGIVIMSSDHGRDTTRVKAHLKFFTVSRKKCVC